MESNMPEHIPLSGQDIQILARGPGTIAKTVVTWIMLDKE